MMVEKEVYMNFISVYKRTVLIPALLFVSLIAFSCSATSSNSPINVDSDGIAIKGFDTVAYFTIGKPVKGDTQFGYNWNGARWLFASQKHMNLFMASPEKYAPQYGGY
jgi:YHS domain-containing protein